VLEILPGEGTQLLLACAATFLAGLIRGFAGFGSGMIMVAVLLSLYHPMIAMPTVLFTEVVLSLVMLPAVWREAHWRLILPMVVAAAITAPLGVMVLGILSETVAKTLASAMIMAFVMLAIFRKTTGQATGRTDVLCAGGMSGLLGGVAGMTGPPVVALLLRTPMSPREVRASLIGYFVIVDTWLLISFSLQTSVGHEYLKLGLIMLVPLISGSLLGAWLFPKASPRAYRNLALATISAAAVASPIL
jgi:uncharacterized membrane protein YfcA